jgi:hypothetical protein
MQPIDEPDGVVHDPTTVVRLVAQLIQAAPTTGVAMAMVLELILALNERAKKKFLLYEPPGRYY